MRGFVARRRGGAVLRRPGGIEPLNGRQADFMDGRAKGRRAVARQLTKCATAAVAFGQAGRLLLAGREVRSGLQTNLENGLGRVGVRSGDVRSRRREDLNGQRQRDEQRTEPAAPHGLRPLERQREAALSRAHFTPPARESKFFRAMAAGARRGHPLLRFSSRSGCAERKKARHTKIAARLVFRAAPSIQSPGGRRRLALRPLVRERKARRLCSTPVR